MGSIVRSLFFTAFIGGKWMPLNVWKPQARLQRNLAHGWWQRWSSRRYETSRIVLAVFFYTKWHNSGSIVSSCYYYCHSKLLKRVYPCRRSKSLPEAPISWMVTRAYSGGKFHVAGFLVDWGRLPKLNANECSQITLRHKNLLMWPSIAPRSFLMCIGHNIKENISSASLTCRPECEAAWLSLIAELTCRRSAKETPRLTSCLVQCQHFPFVYQNASPTSIVCHFQMYPDCNCVSFLVLSNCY